MSTFLIFISLSTARVAHAKCINW